MIKTVITTERFENGELIERTVEETSDDKPVGIMNVHVFVSVPDHADVTQIAENLTARIQSAIESGGAKAANE
ncbi:hypothetical protein [Paenibacillus sp. Cedars]|uniref:hypothetical protein n=1 Tax=Paenibacillus sp. Cedars TaxID=1980674 RepID=UPI001162063C|nr:hypothetical protein [Paenibacillus sp. Cedars]AWP28723.1 hypothetical protein B9D94_19745 [Paenibacillus sp. Cedars]